MSAKPAILGGDPEIQISDADFAQTQRWPNLGETELGAVARIFRDGNISTHPVIRELESAYSSFAERTHALAHNNGTSALMAAYWALDLQPGDKVLVPSATFWASVVPMLWLGLVPVFCETDGVTLGLDLEDARKRLCERTRAMVLVPLWGVPCDYDAQLAFAAEHDLMVIEDASHAHGAAWKGKPCGSFGNVSVFSLQGDKLAPAGEGGIFLTNDSKLWERAQLLGDITRIWELPNQDRRFAATSFGIKTRIAPVSAAIGIEQLRKLPNTNAVRRSNLAPIAKALKRYGFETWSDTIDRKRVYFEFLVRHLGGPLDVEGWRLALLAEGCQVGQPRYPLLHQQPLFTEGVFNQILRSSPDAPSIQYSQQDLPRTQALNACMLKLPHFPNEASDLAEAYTRAIDKVGANQEKIALWRKAQS